MANNVFRSYSSVCQKVFSSTHATHTIETNCVKPTDDTSKVHIDMNKSKVFDFIDLYLQNLPDVDDGRVDERKVLFTASFDTNVPFIVSFKLKHDSALDDSMYDSLESFIIRSLSEFIMENIDVNSIVYTTALTLFTCLFFMTDGSGETATDTSIYIVFPSLRLHKDDAQNKLSKLLVFMRQKLSREYEGDINFDNIHESFIDTDVYDRNCPMYGSWIENYSFHLIDPNVYNMSCSRNDKMEVQQLFENCTDRSPIDAYITNVNSGYVNCQIDGSTMTAMEELQLKHGLKYLFYIAMSTNYNNSYVLPSSTMSRNKKKSEVYEPKNDIEIFNDLMALISRRSKAMNRENVWMDVGNVVNTLFGSRNGLNIWKDFTSSLSTKYTEDDCDRRFHTLTNRVIGVKTIAHHVKQLFPNKYRVWQDKWIKSAFIKMKHYNDHEIAESFYRMFWLKYVCTSASSDRGWYMFVGPYWVEMKSVSPIVKDLNTEFLAKIESHIQSLMELSAKQMANSSVKDTISAKIEAFLKITKDLGNRRFVNPLIKMMYMFEDDPESKFNQNPNLFPFQNCVTECIEGNVVVRDGYPEDYILGSVPHDLMDYTWDSYPVKLYLEYLRQMFNDDDVIMLVRKILASRLLSGNKDKKFIFEIGPTGASKSQFKKLRDLSYGSGAGKFAFTFDNSIMTNKKKAGGPSPEIDQATGARLGFFCEFDVSAVLVADGLLKTFSGADDYFSRSCNQNGGMRKTTFMLFFQANNPPTIVCSDDAIKDRFIYIPFLSKWRKNAPTDPEEQKRKRIYMRNNDFEKQLKIMAPALLWVMVQDFPKYYEEGLEMPAICKEFVRKYWEENDQYFRFMRECLVKTDNNCDIIDIGTIYTMFCEWFRHNNPTQNDVDMKVFSYEIKNEERLGDFTDEGSSIWCGWRIKNGGPGMGGMPGMNGQVGPPMPGMGGMNGQVGPPMGI